MSHRNDNNGSSLSLNEQNLKRGISTPGAIGVAVNQIIGGGIVSLTGTAIAMTGGGVPWAFTIAVCTIIITSIPYASLGAAMPVVGGAYTYGARMLHPIVGFGNMWVKILGHSSLSLYGLSAGEYLHALNPWFSPTWVAVALISIFYVANMMGAAFSSRIGLVLLVVMLVGFLVFVIGGFTQIDWSNYPPSLPNGFGRMLSAAALLTFATGGGYEVAELGKEMKNPGRSIPIAIVGGTAVVGVLYLLISLPAAGILPIKAVANEPLSTVAKQFLPHSLWVFFIVGGAMVAVISTMNAQLLWGTKALLAACDDEWIPKGLGSVNRRFGTPHYLLSLLFLIGIVPAVAHIDISVIGTAASAIAQLGFIVFVLSSIRIRYKYPLLYDQSSFKLPKTVHWILTVVGVGVSAYQTYLLSLDFTAAVWAALLIWIGLGVILLASRYRKAIRAIRAQTEEATETGRVSEG